MMNLRQPDSFVARIENGQSISCAGERGSADSTGTWWPRSARQMPLKRPYCSISAVQTSKPSTRPSACSMSRRMVRASTMRSPNSSRTTLHQWRRPDRHIMMMMTMSESLATNRTQINVPVTSSTDSEAIAVSPGQHGTANTTELVLPSVKRARNAVASTTLNLGVKFIMIVDNQDNRP